MKKYFNSLYVGTGEVIGTLDDDLAHFLESDFYPHLNNTLLVLLSDHGNHMSPFYLWTPDGTIEHRLPALYFLFPRWCVYFCLLFGFVCVVVAVIAVNVV